MRRRVLLFGAAIAALGAFLTLTPIQTTPMEAPIVADGEWTEVYVPSLASVLGGPITVQVSWGAPEPPCVGCYLNRPLPRPFSIAVFDCGESPCVNGSSYAAVGASDYSIFTAVNFPASSGHHYQIWAHQFPPGGGSTEFRISMLTPLLGAIPGLGLLALGGVAVAYGLWATGPPRSPWPAATRP